MGWASPISEPNPIAAQDVQERVSHAMKAAAHSGGKLLMAERSGGLQHSGVRPTLVHLKKPNVIPSHSYLHKTFTRSAIQINSNTEKLRPKQAHRPRIPGAAWQMTGKPALALTRIVV